MPYAGIAVPTAKLSAELGQLLTPYTALHAPTKLSSSSQVSHTAHTHARTRTHRPHTHTHTRARAARTHARTHAHTHTHTTPHQRIQTHTRTHTHTARQPGYGCHPERRKPGWRRLSRTHSVRTTITRRVPTGTCFVWSFGRGGRKVHSIASWRVHDVLRVGAFNAYADARRADRPGCRLRCA